MHDEARIITVGQTDLFVANMLADQGIRRGEVVGIEITEHPPVRHLAPLQIIQAFDKLFVEMNKEIRRQCMAFMRFLPRHFHADTALSRQRNREFAQPIAELIQIRSQSRRADAKLIRQHLLFKKCAFFH